MKTSAILAFLLALSSCLPSSAKLGQDFADYKTRVASSFVPSGQQGDVYTFNMNVDPKQAMASPGYAGALTVNVGNGRILSQTLVLRPGMQPNTGPVLATLHGFAFAYEALGKEVPKNEKALDAEMKAFGGAVGKAFLGQPQNLRYPGYPGLITVSRDGQGNLVVSAKYTEGAPSTSTATRPALKSSATGSATAPVETGNLFARTQIKTK
jgi:hypothetical protein